MFRKMILVALVAFAAPSLVAACGPSVNSDANEGGSCSSNGDCGGDLVCQPVTGRQGDYCCPTPATASKKASCQPAS
jgi:hypothetical protein